MTNSKIVKRAHEAAREAGQTNLPLRQWAREAACLAASDIRAGLSPTAAASAALAWCRVKGIRIP